MHRLIVRNSGVLATLSFTLASGCAMHSPEQGNPEQYGVRPGNVQVTPDDARPTEPGHKASGIIVHIDPSSGEFTTSPSPMPAQGPQQSLERAGEAPSELRETLSPVPGGGVMIHLGERSFTPLTATIDPEGKVRLEHVPAPPDSRDK